MTTTPTIGAADRAIEGCPELNMGNYDEVDVERLNDWAIRANDEIDRLHALAAGQATAAPAQPVAQQPHRSGCTAGTDEACVQRGCGTNCPAVSPRQGVAYVALHDEGEPWRGHKFKEVQRGCWRCDCGKTIKEVTSDQSTPASGGNYPVMPKRYTVDDDGEELFTAEKMRAFADATHTLRASHGEAPAQTADSQLLQFYGVTTDAELIAAQAAHIEKLQAKLTKTPSFAPQRVREG